VSGGSGRTRKVPARVMGPLRLRGDHTDTAPWRVWGRPLAIERSAAERRSSRPRTVRRPSASRRPPRTRRRLAAARLFERERDPTCARVQVRHDVEVEHGAIGPGSADPQYLGLGVIAEVVVVPEPGGEAPGVARLRVVEMDAPIAAAAPRNVVAPP
jgi:hypothetical protein